MKTYNDRGIGSELVGKVFPVDTFEVLRDHTVGYALAVNDENEKYVKSDSAAVIAPPMFGICFANRIMRDAIDSGILPLPLERTVHGEHEMRFLSPIRPGDVLVTEGTVTNVKQHSTGSTVEIEIASKTRDGTLRICQTQTLFVRVVSSKGTHRRSGSSALNPEYTATNKVPKDQASRYAKASFTEGAPQHEDHEYARSLGYDTYFLTGQNTLAFAAKAIVNCIANGDPARLRRLKVRFSQVVYPCDVLTTNIRRGSASSSYLFETVKQDGSAVLTNGKAEVYRQTVL